MTRSNVFTRFARAVSRLVGHPMAFVLAAVVVLVWACMGPMFHYSDTWQLIINTSTTIVTFLIVVLIQNTQNRDSQAMQIKLDELIRAVKGAHNALLDLEELSDHEMRLFGERFRKLADRARTELRSGHADTGSPQLDVSEEEEKEARQPQRRRTRRG